MQPIPFVALSVVGSVDKVQSLNQERRSSVDIATDLGQVYKTLSGIQSGTTNTWRIFSAKYAFLVTYLLRIVHTEQVL